MERPSTYIELSACRGDNEGSVGLKELGILGGLEAVLLGADFDETLHLQTISKK